MPKIFALVYAVWLFSEIILNRMMRAAATDKQGSDKRSLAFIWLLVVVSITAAVYVSMRYPLEIANHIAVNYFGLVVMVAGILLRLSVISTLGKMFTVNVTIRKNHQLKTDGFYRWVRHPSYSASLLTFIGFGISLNNWFALPIIAAGVLPGFFYRMNVEEAALTEAFGEQYAEYKKQTKRLVPFLY